MNVTDNYFRLKKQIPKDVCLIAVSKKQPIEKLEELYETGHRDFGENYAQELLERAEYFLKKGNSDIRWHFLGHLQRNKVKMLMPHVAAIHTVDSKRLFEEIQKYKKTDVDLFLQVNIDQEESKSGVSPSDVEKFIVEIGKENLKGLMCIPSPDTSDAFLRLRKLRDQYLSHGGLSMGMSADYLNAIKEGATHIRVGTSIFGERA